MKAQRQEQEKDRLVYFSEVFELKDMIEQRIAETETYRDQLANDKDWRYVAQEIIFPELTTAIQILITKAEEIEETIEEQINSYLTQFN